MPGEKKKKIRETENGVRNGRGSAQKQGEPAGTGRRWLLGRSGQRRDVKHDGTNRYRVLGNHRSNVTRLGTILKWEKDRRRGFGVRFEDGRDSCSLRE